MDKGIEAKYEDRYVAYLDVLGTKNTVYNSDFPNDLIESLMEVNEVKNQVNEADMTCDGLEKTIFSDSIVFSMRAGKDGFSNLCSIVMYIYIAFLERNYFIRGGISYGQMFHHDGIAVGPALIEAYNLEQKAIFPRCIFNRGLFTQGAKELQKVPACIYIDTFIDISNGIFMVDYLRDFIKILDFSEKDIVAQMNTIKVNIERNLLEYKDDTNILKKYKWMAEYFNRTLQPTQLDIKKNDTKMYDEHLAKVKPIKF